MPLLALLVLVLAGCLHPASAGWITNLYGPHTSGVVTETDQVPESSGVVASRTSPDIFWTHNDSGPYAPRVWAFRLSQADVAAGVARHMGYVELAGATQYDWEDIAAGPGQTIHIFDGGDNPPCDRADKRIHRFLEPTIDPAGDPVSLTLPFDSIRFDYPDSANPSQPAGSNDDRYDAECLFVHPESGDLYIVTKRSNSNAATARVYKLPADAITWNSSNVHVLQFVVDISPAVPSMVSAGDVDAAGRRVLVRNYTGAYEFTLPEAEPFDAVFQQPPRWISLLIEPQGEGICYGADGGDIITTSEGTPTRVFITPWRLANARAEPVHLNRATIRWDTADPLGSNVNYGTTTGYGDTVDDPAPVTSHDVELAGLGVGTQYFYRVASGTLVYPAPADAGSVFFVTRAYFKADFDRDNDVDQDDFGHLQVCFTGAGAAQEDPACADTRLDPDSDVDLNDFVLFKACMSGPDVTPDPQCEPW